MILATLWQDSNVVKIRFGVGLILLQSHGKKMRGQKQVQSFGHYIESNGKYHTKHINTRHRFQNFSPRSFQYQ